jgi:hypothetical protein
MNKNVDVVVTISSIEDHNGATEPYVVTRVWRYEFETLVLAIAVLEAMSDAVGCINAETLHA